MSAQNIGEERWPKRNLLYRFDQLITLFIPNFNIRAILYLSVLFGVAVFIQIWRITAPPKTEPIAGKKETVIADQSYWDSPAYKEKIHNQTVDSFTQELEQWLKGVDKEFSKRKFEDMLFINGALNPVTGGDLTMVVPQSFNELENGARARYQYARSNGFLADAFTIVKLGTVVCDIDAATAHVTDIELYDWRYASMPKLAAFMNTKPDWNMPVGNRIFDVSDPVINNTAIVKRWTAQTQPVGLFSFLIFRNTNTNRIVVADSKILDQNGIDAQRTLRRMSGRLDMQPKLYFRSGYEGCKELGSAPLIHYGQSD